MATLINIDGSEIEIHPLSMLRRREELRSSGNKRFCEVQMVRPWSVHILAFQIGKGYCGLCTRCLSVNELSDPQSIYEEHASHISQVSISGTIIGLSEYRGLEMTLPVARLAAADYSEGILTVPYAIFKLSCQYCHSEDFPLTSKDVRTFRALHRAHIESTYVHVVTHTPLGQIIAQAISVQAQYSDDQLAKACANQRVSPLVTSRAQQLQNLWLSLSCMPRGLDCRGCNSKQYFKDWSQSEGFLAEHRDHIHHLYVHVSVIAPNEYEGLRLRLLAHTFPARSLTAGMRIDCIMLELAANDGTSPVTPRSRMDIDRYLDSARGCGGARLRALVYGRAGRIFERQIDVGSGIRSNSAAHSEKCPKQNVRRNAVKVSV